MNKRSTVFTAALAVACVTLVTGCGKTQSSEAAAVQPVYIQPKKPVRPSSLHALDAPAEARRLTNLVNARQAAAMSQLENNR